MKYKELNREDARIIFDEYKDNGIPNDLDEELSPEYQKIREDILRLCPKPIEKNYLFDLRFGISLYTYFSKSNFDDFNEAVASNYDFWRYICLKVVPDIIYERHGFMASYFYEKNVRLYIPTLWWYIEMAYQGDIASTFRTLSRYSTDYILNFVERPGRDGLYIDVVRYIFKYLDRLSMDVINEKKLNQTLIRRLLIQHTAKSSNYNLVVEGKTEQYVKELFKTCGVEV